MFRILNIIAMAVLMGSAVYAYEIKYATMYQAEQLAKAKRDLAHETDVVAVLRAEWARVANPDRIEVLADKYLPGQILQLSQIVTANAVPDKVARPDEIGAALEDPKLSNPKSSTPGSAAPTHALIHATGALTTARTGR